MSHTYANVCAVYGWEMTCTTTAEKVIVFFSNFTMNILCFYRVLKVSAHIDACASSCTPKYHILTFYKMNTQSALARRDKEAYFIQKTKPARNSMV